MKAFVKVSAGFLEFVFDKKVSLSCEVNTPIAPKRLNLRMKVLQLENRLVSLGVHTPLKYLMHITNTYNNTITKAQLIILHNHKTFLKR